MNISTLDDWWRRKNCSTTEQTGFILFTWARCLGIDTKQLRSLALVRHLPLGSLETWTNLDRAHQYVALKVYVRTSLVHRELPSYHHIASRMKDSTHEGRGNVRRLLDSFVVNGPDGDHVVLVFEPAQMSLRDMKVVFRPEGFDEDFVRGAIIELLKALDFLHTHGEIVHTGICPVDQSPLELDPDCYYYIHPGNMLLGVFDNSIFQAIEEKEYTDPVPRKQVSPTRIIYLSRLMRPKEGPMLLSDFGEARIGREPHGGDIMPLEYRAPETLLYVGWSYPVDIWSVGLTAWDLLEPKRLFTARDDDGDLYDAAHLAQIIAALGPPPVEFLAKTPERRADFWDDEGTLSTLSCGRIQLYSHGLRSLLTLFATGKWLGLAPIPEARTMEALECRLKDKAGFLSFIRRALTWMPEERATAKELLQDPWLSGRSR
ncbi:protein kinase, putative [Aspergillus fumigatus Af293]|uniref:non-specific serine/threonine protein kinase n=1 Tax=Aspergillus fumigatus (strain ATCC MYA-4609 / CBS 101355 / FGSC A1100 / Af293) TaxID=330879 RepID=Q4WFE3_ASPFU|nr:protein kinase, putative [Aspergillus fumigatus Af293]EAL86534.1 protein kinase, putative [Aspergillus fumigatus Af293]